MVFISNKRAGVEDGFIPSDGDNWHVDDADAVREHVLETHRETLVAVQECADAVAAGRECAAGATDGRTLAADLERELRREGVLDAFPDLLAGAVAAAGRELTATPVAAPPYVAVTSVGPVARATVGDERLVIAIEVFGVERGEYARYVRRPRRPAESLTVELR